MDCKISQLTLLASGKAFLKKYRIYSMKPPFPAETASAWISLCSLMTYSQFSVLWDPSNRLLDWTPSSPSSIFLDIETQYFMCKLDLRFILLYFYFYLCGLRKTFLAFAACWECMISIKFCFLYLSRRLSQTFKGFSVLLPVALLSWKLFPSASNCDEASAYWIYFMAWEIWRC